MGVTNMNMPNISRTNIENINSIARAGTGELFKSNGDYFTIISLAMYLLREELSIDRISRWTQPKERKYMDIVDWLKRFHYLKVQIYPYRIMITDSFRELYNSGDEICEGVQRKPDNEVKQ
jgi:hypothetical protein